MSAGRPGSPERGRLAIFKVFFALEQGVGRSIRARVGESGRRLVESSVCRSAGPECPTRPNCNHPGYFFRLSRALVGRFEYASGSRRRRLFDSSVCRSVGPKCPKAAGLQSPRFFSQNARFWVSFSSPTRAYTELQLETSIFEPGVATGKKFGCYCCTPQTGSKCKKACVTASAQLVP